MVDGVGHSITTFHSPSPEAAGGDISGPDDVPGCWLQRVPSDLRQVGPLTWGGAVGRWRLPCAHGARGSEQTTGASYHLCLWCDRVTWVEVQEDPADGAESAGGSASFLGTLLA